MIDIETLATSSDAALVSIAAVRFDLATGIIGDSIYIKIDKQSCLDYGLVVDADTVDWWMRQSKEAQEYFYYSSIWFYFRWVITYPKI